MEDKRLTEKISAASATDDALIHIVEPGNVSQHPTGSSFKAKAKDVVNSFQNNIPYYKYLTFVGLGPLTTAEVVNKLNFTGMFGNFVITEIDTPVLISGLKTDGNSLLRHMYIFTGGKGIYGSGEGQTLVTEDHLIKISTFPATIQDIPNDSNTQTIPLGELPDGDYLAAANSEERDFTNEDIVYFFSYVQDGVEYRVLFNGTPGVYGGEGNPQFIGSDLIPSTNSNVLPTIPTWEETLEQNNQSSIPPIVFDTVTEEKTTYAGTGMIHQDGEIVSTVEWQGDTAATKWQHPTRNGGVWNYMAKEDIQENLPEDFFISCVQSSMGVTEVGEGTKIMYITDQQRYLLLEGVYAPVMSGACYSVIIEGNKVFILYHIDYLEGYRQYGMISLDCRIINNILTPISFQHQLIPEDELQTTTSPNVTMHSEAYKGGWLYYATRDTSQPTRFLKVNANNVTEYRIVSATDIGLIDGGGFNNIEIWGNYIYFLYTANPHTNDHIGRVDINFNYYERIVDLSPDDVRTIPEQNPFVIYHNQIFTYTVDKTNTTTLNNKFRVQAYNLDGELLRESDIIEIPPDTTDGIILPHWMTVFNGKMLMHTAQQNSVRKLLIRLDVGYGKTGEDNYVPITLEEYVTIPARGVTDDNTITSYGEIWLNSETSTSFPDERRLFIVDNYLDLATLHEYNDLNYSSTGTPPTKVEREINYLPVSAAPVDVSPKIIKLDPVTTSAVTGTTQAIVASYLIPGGTLENGIFNVLSRLQKVGAGGAATYQFYINTSNSLSGASDLSIFTSAANGRDTNFKRTFVVKGNNIMGSAKSVSLISDEVAMVTAPTTTAYTVANNYYFIVAVTLAVGTDSVTQEYFELTFKKQH